MTVTLDQIRDAWDAIATGYDQFVTPTNMDQGNEALQLAGLQPGMRFLDVAAGSGALSIPAARLGARVLATDLSPAMVERLGERVGREGLSDRVECRVMDGHALELEDGCFDMAGSQFGVMLFPDMQRGLAELARVTKAGGRVVMVVLGPPAKVEFFTFFANAIQKVVPSFADPSDPPPLPFQLGDPQVLRRVMRQAGLDDVRVETTNKSLEFTSAQQMWEWLVNSNPVAGSLLVELDLSDEQLRAIKSALGDLLRDRIDTRGVAVVDSQVHIAIGTK